MDGRGRQRTGRRGEDEAAAFLEKEGFRILERNWRHSRLEVDIIALRGNELHIVEVKSRTVPAAAPPEVNVNRRKCRHLTDAANAYMHAGSRAALPADLDIYFDIVSVVFDGPDFDIEYYPKAFTPIYA